MTATTPLSLAEILAQLGAESPYVGYSYAYPHKTAYRPLAPSQPLGDVWRDEPRDALFLYVHIPFCEFRCGFCNLFALSQPHEALVQRYLQAIERQAAAVRRSLGEVSFARMALGGGTPTFLSIAELGQLFDAVERHFFTSPHNVPTGIEASPATIDAEKLAWLHERGIERVSLGVQSFDTGDVGAMGRPQRADDVARALSLLRDADFPTLNIDLINGADGQTLESFLASIHAAVAYRPEEIYLYPLYVRPLTGLGRRAQQWDDFRLAAYRAGCDLLVDYGYEQVSMRMFRAVHACEATGPVYCCQDDGMIGLGCGARSYTRTLHYAQQYAVEPRAIAAIVNDFVALDAASLSRADYGFVLDVDEQRRRFVITSLLQAEGLDRRHYATRFAAEVRDDFSELTWLESTGLAEIDIDRVRLTAAGLELSDAIGPWLYSPGVRERMEAFTWR